MFQHVRCGVCMLLPLLSPCILPPACHIGSVGGMSHHFIGLRILKPRSLELGSPDYAACQDAGRGSSREPLDPGTLSGSVGPGQTSHQS